MVLGGNNNIFFKKKYKFSSHLDVFMQVNITYLSTLQKHAYLNIKKISSPKTENFEIKNSDIFSYFCSKHRLWVLVRTASARRF